MSRKRKKKLFLYVLNFLLSTHDADSWGGYLVFIKIHVNNGNFYEKNTGSETKFPILYRTVLRDVHPTKGSLSFGSLKTYLE